MIKGLTPWDFYSLKILLLVAKQRQMPNPQTPGPADSQLPTRQGFNECNEFVILLTHGKGPAFHVGEDAKGI